MNKADGVLLKTLESYLENRQRLRETADNLFIHRNTLANRIIKSDELVYGSGFWFEPGVYQEGMQFFGPYRYRGPGGDIKFTMEYSDGSYDYFHEGYYTGAMASPGKVAWQGPFYDKTLNATMLSSAATIQKNGKSVGVVTVTVGIAALEDYVRGISIGENGYAFLVSKDGYYLATKDDSKNMKAKITEDPNPALAALGKKVTEADKLLLEETDAFGEESYVMVAPLCIDNLKLVLVAPESDYDGPIKKCIYMSIFMAVLVLMILCAVMITILRKH